ncbi:MAG: cbb3-type cytochrome c oxidase N-terminal domain-containing protein [Bacteroidia bacterium]
MTKLTKNAIWFACLFLIPLSNYAQGPGAVGTTTYFSNALFNTLLVVIIILLIVIIGLNAALKNITQSEYIQNKLKKKETNENDVVTKSLSELKETKDNNTITKSLSVLILLFVGYNCNAQSALSSSQDWLIGGLDMFTFYFMSAIILFEFILMLVLYNIIMGILKTDKVIIPVAKPKTKTILEKLNASVDIEKEADIMLDHNYDGIVELDNDLPPWWKYGFYLTIIIGVIYLINFHVAETGDLQTVEYEKSLIVAKAEVDEYMKTAANNVDETTVKQLEGADLETGKELFITNCATCHGKFGQGTVGPNLTDAYWLHGGGLSDIFKTVKYGWVDKGMKSWKEDLSPIQIAQISSFIRTLNGTNPAGAKVAQGDLYKEEKISVSDTLVTNTDSLNILKDTIH